MTIVYQSLDHKGKSIFRRLTHAIHWIRTTSFSKIWCPACFQRIKAINSIEVIFYEKIFILNKSVFWKSCLDFPSLSDEWCVGRRVAQDDEAIRLFLRSRRSLSILTRIDWNRSVNWRRLVLLVQAWTRTWWRSNRASSRTHVEAPKGT